MWLTEGSEVPTAGARPRKLERIFSDCCVPPCRCPGPRAALSCLASFARCRKGGDQRIARADAALSGNGMAAINESIRRAGATVARPCHLGPQ
eukprot:3472388-Pyramimonas_sp.AAC.1